MKKLLIAAAALLMVATAAQAQNAVAPISRSNVVAAVKARLNDPQSAQFRQIIRVAPAIACGHVSAKNGFGGYGQPQAFIVAGGANHAGAHLQGDRGFMQSWNTFCAGKSGTAL